MPTKKATRLNVTTSQTKFNKRWLWIGVLVVIILLLGFAAYWITSGNTHYQEAKIATHLKEKYGKEFVVKNYRIEGAGLGVEGDPHADAYPKDDPSLEFDIRDSGAYKIGSHTYWDDYVAATWMQDEKKELSPALSRALNYTPNFTVEIHVQDGSTASREMDKNNLPSLKEGARKYKNDISYTLRVESKLSQNELNKVDFASQYIQLMGLVEDRVGYIRLEYSLSLPSGKNYGISLRNSDFKNITMPEQLLDKFQEWSIIE